MTKGSPMSPQSRRAVLASGFAVLATPVLAQNHAHEAFTLA
jgi:hypothetical protein